MSRQKEKKAVTLKTYIAWLSRGVSMSVNAILIMQLTYYCTNSLGLAAASVGMVLMAARLFDGITDLVAGYLIDKTNTRWGKARPYEICIVFVWLFTVLLFSTPNFGNVGKLVFIFVVYTLHSSVFSTFLNAGDSVLLARSVEKPEDQQKILSLTAPFGMIFNVLASIALPIVIKMWGDQPGGWTKIALIFAIPFGIIGTGRLLFMKERAVSDTQKAERFSMKTALYSLKNNKYIFMIAGAFLLSNLITNIGSGIGLYYYQYIYGDIGMMSLVSMIGVFTPIALFAIPALLKKHSLLSIVRASALLGLLGNIIKFVGGINVPCIMVGNLLASLSLMPISMMIGALVIQCMDYGEWKTGERVEGVYSSLNGFASKVGAGLASAGVGLIMGVAGFDGTLAVQTQSANNSIIALYSIIPAILFAVMFVLTYFCKLDKVMEKVYPELEARRKGNG